MIVVRSELRAKFGQGGHLAGQAVLAMEAMQEELSNSCPTWRVLTDLSGEFDSVTIETEVESLAALEQARSKMLGNEAYAKAMKGMSDMAVSGTMSFLNLEATG